MVNLCAIYPATYVFAILMGTVLLWCAGIYKCSFINISGN